ncbi:MAG: radical SAM protein [Planctomycetes bacterium]|nr:radical SAM protein [Planctomycetota bacterium]
MKTLLRKVRKALTHPERILPALRHRAQMLPYYVRRDGTANLPQVIYLSINSICNLKCKMCDVGVENAASQFFKNLCISETRHPEISLERFKRLVDEVRSFKPKIAITSTEPLLYKPIVEAIRYAREAGLHVQVTTNAFLLDRYAKAFVEAGLNELWVSLDGPAAVHNQVRGVPRSFERAVDGMLAVMKHRKELNRRLPVLATNFAISNHNFHSLTAYLDSVQELGLDLEQLVFSHMNYVLPETAAKHNLEYGHICRTTPSSVTGATPLEVDTDVLWDQLLKIKTEYAHLPIGFTPEMDRGELEDFYRRPDRFIHQDRCQVPWFMAQILATGDLIPMTRCFNMPLGNIHDGTFAEAWNGEKMRQFRVHLQRFGTFPACSRCCGIL